jgi:hypothetical protein
LIQESYRQQTLFTIGGASPQEYWQKCIFCLVSGKRLQGTQKALHHVGRWSVEDLSTNTTYLRVHERCYQLPKPVLIGDAIGVGESYDSARGVADTGIPGRRRCLTVSFMEKSHRMLAYDYICAVSRIVVYNDHLVILEGLIGDGR